MHLYLVFLLLFGCTDYPKKTAPSAASLILKNQTISFNDSLTLDALYQKSNRHNNLGQVDSAFFYDKLLLAKAKGIRNTYYMARAHHNIGYYYDGLSIPDSAYYHFSQSRNSFEKLKDSTAVAKVLLLISFLEKNGSDFFGSKETLTEAIRYFSNAHQNKYKASIYNELATNHRKLQNYDDAIVYYQKSIAFAPSEKTKLIFKNNLAATYIDQGKYKKAIGLLQEIKNDTSLQKGTTNYARVLDNLRYAQWLNGEKITENQFLKALRIRKDKNDKRGQIASYTHLGEYWLKTNPAKAWQYLDTVIQLSQRLKIPKAEQDALKFQMQLRPKNVDIRDRYVFLQDSLYKVGLKVKTQFAKMKYDDELKQQAILRLEKETAEKNTELARQRAQNILGLSFTGLLLMGGVFLFYGLRQRHKKEKLQEVYATEKRISKKVHDELANDIYGVMAKIQHTPDLKKEDMLDDLEHVYRSTRNISHEHAAIRTDAGFVPDIKDLLGRYRSEHTAITSKGLEESVFKNVESHKKVAVYRVLNELMVNMKKHSNASHVALTFERLQKKVKIGYADNGQGMESNTKKNVGLQNTENRIKSINGTFTFESEPGKGVKVTLTFPV